MTNEEEAEKMCLGHIEMAIPMHNLRCQYIYSDVYKKPKERRNANQHKHEMLRNRIAEL